MILLGRILVDKL